MILLCDRQPFSNLRELLNHRMTRKPLNVCHFLIGSGRLYLDTYERRLLRPLSELADMEAQLGPIGRYVDPVGLLKRLWVGFATVADRRGFFAMLNFGGRPKDARKLVCWFPPMSETRVFRCALLDGCKCILHFWQSSHPRLDTREK